MTKIIAFILLVTPAFAGAQGETPVVSAKPPVAQAEPAKKTNVYETIADELLKNCEGTDKKIAVAGFSYSDGRDSRDGGVVAERITTELVKAKKFKVIERKEIEEVFEELNRQMLLCSQCQSAVSFMNLKCCNELVSLHALKRNQNGEMLFLNLGQSMPVICSISFILQKVLEKFRDQATL